MAFGYQQVNAGKFDRRIKLFKQFTHLNELNESEDSYIHVLTVWAQVKHLSTMEKYDAESIRASKITEFYIRYRDLINETYRIEHDSKTYRITGITEMGRRELLCIMTEFVQGQA